MTERRRLKRRHVIFYSRVFDLHTGQLMGHLMDITREGMRLISEEPTEVGKTFLLRIDLPEDVMDKPFVKFEARSLWCKQDINPAFYNTGYLISNMSAEDVTLIDNMMEEVGFRDDV
jgi:hypothetical protein